MQESAPEFTQLNELASSKIGGKILFATDDWFAAAENLLSPQDAVFKPDVFTEYGKEMDGWETRRKRCPGHDWCLIKLGAPGIIRGIEVDTAFFTGNYTPKFSLQTAEVTAEDEKLIPKRKHDMIGTAASQKDFEKIHQLGSDKWHEPIPMTPLRPGYEATRHNYFEIKSSQVCTHLRLNMYPDGGIARLKVYGEVVPDLTSKSNQTIDLVGMKNGGTCVGYSNAHYGHPKNLIQPESGINMGDGWETARRLDRPAILLENDQGILQVSGSEWAVFKLGHLGVIEKIEIDTKHFKGNFPDSVKVEGLMVGQKEGDVLKSKEWQIVTPVSKLSAHKVHPFGNDMVVNKGPFTHVKVTMAPDGGMSRLRVYGKVVSSDKS